MRARTSTSGLRQSLVRAATAWILLLSHLFAIFSAPFLLIDFSDAMDVILIMCPLTGAFVLIVVQHYAEIFDETEQSSVFINTTAATMTLFFCIVLAIAIMGVQLMYWSGRIPSIDLLKRAVGTIDTVIGGYTAILTKKLFAS